jgi:hypothetical protein
MIQRIAAASPICCLQVSFRPSYPWLHFLGFPMDRSVLRIGFQDFTVVFLFKSQGQRRMHNSRLGCRTMAFTVNKLLGSSTPSRKWNFATKVMVKLSRCLIKRHIMDTYGRVETLLHAFLTSALNGGEGSTSRPDRFTPADKAFDTLRIWG